VQVNTLVLPDYCFPGCWNDQCNLPDWENCPEAVACSAPPAWSTDPRELSAHARHLGGSNMGFLDGHAGWMSQGQIIAHAPRYSCGCWGGAVVGGDFEGLLPGAPTASPTSNMDGDTGMVDCGVVPFY
ncbi:MAG: hypothetical protein MUQ65_11650, partial [Armatimonadetes bacterium]|nr:hypothetical protein [Armatimonadota bacterium]